MAAPYPTGPASSYTTAWDTITNDILVLGSAERAVRVRQRC
jgi:hypothetical protein